VAADLDGDGRDDVATVAQGTGELIVRLGDGSGQFVPGFVGPAGGSAKAVAVADLNGDVSFDLVTTDDNRILAWINDGAGQFTTTPYALQASPGAMGADALVLADFDGDQVPDVATANSLQSTVSVLLGDGSGGFGSGQAFGTGTQPSDLTVGECNRAGDLDLAVSTIGGPAPYEVSILFGTGTGHSGLTDNTESLRALGVPGLTATVAPRRHRDRGVEYSAGAV
jgi:hypothetical protein